MPRDLALMRHADHDPSVICRPALADFPDRGTAENRL